MTAWRQLLKTGFLALGLLCGVSGARAADCRSPPCRYSVGFRVIQTEVGGRMMAVAVWYPSDASPGPIAYGTARVAGRAAADAPVKAGKWPLVVFAHGYSGSGVGYATLAETVASYGFVWAAPDLTDEVTEVRLRGPITGDIRAALRNLVDEPPTLATYGYRVEQTRAALDAMLARPEISVDPGRLALAGHSLGAWTVLHLALQDPRPHALVLYSMGELNYLFKRERFFSPEQLARLRIPVFYLYGTRERRAVARYGPTSSEYSWQYTPAPACLAEVRGGDHFVYVNREVAPRDGGDARQLERVGQATVSFLGRYLLGLDNRVYADRCK